MTEQNLGVELVKSAIEAPKSGTKAEIEKDSTAKAEPKKAEFPTPRTAPTNEIDPPKPRKTDPFTQITPDQLPVVAQVGQVQLSVADFNSRPVLSVSLVGWVGEPEFRIPAADIGELEKAIRELRKQLTK